MSSPPGRDIGEPDRDLFADPIESQPRRLRRRDGQVRRPQSLAPDSHARVLVTGYLVTWTGAGIVAFLVGALAGHAAPDLGWDHAGRIPTGATLLVAAAYELTPLKNIRLSKSRSPLGQLLGSLRDGWLGVLRMGMRGGAWCVGCCWALMASLFALDVMNTVWMAVVAVLTALEKARSRRAMPTPGNRPDRLRRPGPLDSSVGGDRDQPGVQIDTDDSYSGKAADRGGHCLPVGARGHARYEERGGAHENPGGFGHHG